MKSLLITVFLPIVMMACTNNNKRHIGEWEGKDNGGKIGSLVLDESNHSILVLGNEVLGGEDFEVDGTKGEAKYEIDYTKDPIWLDLVIYNKEDNSEIGRIKGILKFITDNKMELRMGFDGTRFEKFDSEDKRHTMVLNKK